MLSLKNTRLAFLFCCLFLPLSSWCQCSNIAAGTGIIPDDGNVFCTSITVNTYPAALPVFGTAGQNYLAGIGIDISGCAGDLLITAIPPAGCVGCTPIVLSNHRGGLAGNPFGDATSSISIACNPGAGPVSCGGGTTFSFTVASTGDVTVNSPPFCTNAPGANACALWRPEDPVAFDALVGKNINGTWQLCITDNVPGSCASQPTFNAVGIFCSNLNQPVLAMGLTHFRGHSEAFENVLSWQPAQDAQPVYFELDRSQDGNNFKRIANIPAQEAKSDGSYEFKDVSPEPGFNQYRLRTFDAEGNFSVSNNVELVTRIPELTLSGLFPNPAKDQVSLTVQGMPNEAFEVRLRDLWGREIRMHSYQLESAKQAFELPLKGLAAGNWFVEVKNLSSGQRSTRILTITP